jgi:DNA repair protein RAD5
LIHFLQIHPWSQYSFWHSFISEPFEKKDPKAIEAVQSIIDPILLRRTKTTRDKQGNLIVDLPPKQVDIVLLNLIPSELDIYKALNTYSKRKLYDLKIVGKADYAHIFQLVLLLRQVCDHPLLIQKQAKANMTATVELKELLSNYYGDPSFAQNVESELKQDGLNECPVCLEDCTNGILLPACLHIVCQDCVEGILLKKQEQGLEADCPVCRKPFTESDLLRIIKQEGSQEQSGNREINLQSIKFQKSTKMIALAAELKIIFETDDVSKCVIFSQWTSMLDLIEVTLFFKPIGDA